MASTKQIVLTREHFDEQVSKRDKFGIFEAEYEGIVQEVSILKDPQGLFPIGVQLVTQSRMPIVTFNEIAPIIDGKKLPPPPKATKTSDRASLSPGNPT